MKKLRYAQFDASDGLRCLHCGTPNPDQGPVCGNCGENPFVLQNGETIPFDPRLISKGRLKSAKAAEA